MLQIGNLDGYYHFQLNVSAYDEEDGEDRNTTYLAPRSIGSLSTMNRAEDRSEALMKHNNVNCMSKLKRITRAYKSLVNFLSLES